MRCLTVFIFHTLGTPPSKVPFFFILQIARFGLKGHYSTGHLLLGFSLLLFFILNGHIMPSVRPFFGICVILSKTNKAYIVPLEKGSSSGRWMDGVLTMLQ